MMPYCSAQFQGVFMKVLGMKGSKIVPKFLNFEQLQRHLGDVNVVE